LKKAIAENGTGKNHWLLLKGDINVYGEENLNTVADHGLLWLINGEKINIGEIRFIFWKSTYSHSSPAWISRNSILYLGKEDVTNCCDKC